MSPDAPRDPTGKRALFSGASESTQDSPTPSHEGKRALYSDVEGGVLTVHCSLCGERTPLSMVGFAVQHFPAWFWLPWRRYSHFMRCPACGRFAWHSVKLTA